MIFSTLENILFLIFFVCSYITYLLYLMHMFQLNTYKTNEQMGWMKKNRKALVIRLILPAAAAVACLGFAEAGLLIAAGLWLVNTLLFLRRKKAKKPLVYTQRVIRMLVTHFLLAAIIFGVASGAFHLALWIPATLLYLLLPLLILAVNRINAPVQKMINKKYVNEARKKIADMPNLTVIGITGSYGKTSVKFFLTELLSGRFNVLCTPLNYNTDLGVTKTIRENLQAIHEVFVCEMGARYVNDIRTICDIVHPKYGIITSIGPQHLETFGSMDNIISTKFELYDSIPASGQMFLNYDNEYIRNHVGDKNQVGFGTAPDAKFRLEDVKMSSKGSSFTVCIDNQERIEFVTDLIGEHNILDIVAAISAAYTLGVTGPELVKRVKKLKPVQHRLQLLPGRGRISIIDDAYNSNPNGFKSAVDTLAYFDEVKVIVTPGMIELGEKEYELNYEAGRHASEVCDYVVLVGKKQTKPLYDGVCSNPAFDRSHLHVVETLDEVWKLVGGLTEDPVVVLLENDLPDNY